MKILTFVLVAVLATAHSEYVPVDKFLSTFSNSENVIYVILDCDENNLRKTTELFTGLKSTASETQVNIVTVPFSDGAIKPSVFAKGIDNIVEALEKYACLSNTEEAPQFKNMQSVISRVLPQMHQRDSIVLFTAFDKHEDEKFSSTFFDKLSQKQIMVNVLLSRDSTLPNDYEKLTKITKGNILTYSQPNPQISKLSSKLETKTDQIVRNYAEPDYEISVMKKELQQDTRTQLFLPERTFQIFLTLYGEIRKALLISPSGIIINVLSLDDEYTPMGQNRSVNFDLMISKSPATWTLSASGNRYNVTFMRLTNTERKHDRLLSENKNGVMRSLTSPTAMKQESWNAQALTKRQDILEPGILIEGQPSMNAFGNPNFNVFPTIIDIDLQSTFFVLPGEEARIVINIKNNKPVTSSYHFHCVYPQQPCIVIPTYVTLIPQQSIPVMVRLKAEGTEGSSNVITFISRDVELVYRKIYLYIGRQKSDSTKPDIDYEYNGNCDDANTGNTCHRKRWSAEVNARDTGSGLLNFWSEPPGLLYTSEFIVGTKDPVTARYSASCCEPKVDILASDLKGNTYRVTLNVEHQYLNWIEITAIVLASILLLLLIAVIIFLVLRWRRKKNERSFLDN